MLDIQSYKNIYHFLKAIVATSYYSHPSKRLTVIGVTGTDGKTTTSSLIYHILKSTRRRVSLISTVSASIGREQFDTGFHVTTPSPFMIQNFLKKAADEGDQYFVLETTSHALDQNRVAGIHFSIGLVTNITHEHLQYHKTYDRYVRAKAKLLEASRTAIINRDDQSFEPLKKYVDNSSYCQRLYSYGLKHHADFHFDISKKIGKKLASFNKYNYLGAYAVCHELGLTDEEIFEGMRTYMLPAGRMEVIYDKSFKVIIDFAHTPNALHEALPAIRDEHLRERGRLIHIFGAAAFRDDAKRPMMGEESARNADTTIITEEDYRTEDPYKISREIAAGMIKHHWKEVTPEAYIGTPGTYTVIVDRQKAIEKALMIVQKNDAIVLTGKGHEQSLCRGRKEYPWDDKKNTLSAIRKLIHSTH
jgi:UDP-N-acetylmuramoyl-L-alanyl-D-glutamate--2,6-diaminopimelate ligase